MQLKRLTLGQVRAFDQVELDFQLGMNLLVGVNGAGKSTVLDVLGILLSQILPKISASRATPTSFRTSDMRVGGNVMTAALEMEALDVAFNYLVRFMEGQEDPVREKGRVTEFKIQHERGGEFLPYSRHMQDGFRKHDAQPLAVYFSTRRSVPTMKAPRISGAFGVQATAFAQALAPRQLQLRELADWWRVQDELAAESDQPRFGHHLDVLSTTIGRFLDDCTNLRAVEEPVVTLLIDKGGDTLDVRQLSDGERSMIALVLDLARRLALANPHLKDPIAEGQAVVLIDELDLHLHPGWQRTVVEKLTRTFPKCQFIATTHSPQIVGEVPPEQILLIDNGSVERPNQSLGMDTNWILRRLMDVPERNEPTQEELDAIENLIEAEEYDAALARIEQLRQNLGEFADLVDLQTRIDMIRFLAENEVENEEPE